MKNDLLMDRAKIITQILRDSDEWISCERLAELSGLTIRQVKGAVKFQRRYFLDCPGKCGTVYILSGVKGYKLPQSDDDYVAMYKSLYAWGKSVLVTISPVGKYLADKGFDVKKMREEAMKSHGLDVTCVGGSESWQEE